MPLLSKRRQVSVAKETTGGSLPGAVGTFPTAAQSGLVLIDATAAIDVENIERNVLRDSLTPVKGTVGQQAATFTVTTEIAGANGGAYADGPPLWGTMLQACGFAQSSVEALAVGTVTNGPFQHGELVTQAVSAATGIVVMDTHEGATEVLLRDVTGTFAGTAVITGSSSGATAPGSGASANEGFAWYPVSNVTKNLRVDVTSQVIAAGSLIEGQTSGARAVLLEDSIVGASQIIQISPVRGGAFTAGGETCTVVFDANGLGGGIDVNASSSESFSQWPSVSLNFNEDGQAIQGVGARGNVAFNFEVNRPATATFTMRGVLNSTTDAAQLTGITSDAPSSPPIWQGSAAGWVENETSANTATTAEYLPCLTSLQIDAGVTLADRKCASAATGLVEILGTGRAGTGSIDPEVTLEADIPWLTYAKAGTTARLRVPLGSVDGNQFTFFMPGVQMDSPSYGDRDGIATHDIPFRLTGGFHHNLVGAGTLLDTFGGDNELVIVYHTS
jgi:hypothetical protein